MLDNKYNELVKMINLFNNQTAEPIITYCKINARGVGNNLPSNQRHGQLSARIHLDK